MGSVWGCSSHGLGAPLEVVGDTVTNGTGLAVNSEKSKGY